MTDDPNISAITIANLQIIYIHISQGPKTRLNHMVLIRETLNIDLESLKVFRYLSNKCKQKERRTQNIKMNQV